MMDNYVQKAWEIQSECRRRISPIFLMRKLKINYDFAFKICCKIRLRMHLEARAMAKEIDFEWPSQLDKVKLKNIENLKIKKEKN